MEIMTALKLLADWSLLGWLSRLFGIMHFFRTLLVYFLSVARRALLRIQSLLGIILHFAHICTTNIRNPFQYLPVRFTAPEAKQNREIPKVWSSVEFPS